MFPVRTTPTTIDIGNLTLANQNGSCATNTSFVGSAMTCQSMTVGNDPSRLAQNVESFHVGNLIVSPDTKAVVCDSVNKYTCKKHTVRFTNQKCFSDFFVDMFHGMFNTCNKATINVLCIRDIPEHFHLDFDDESIIKNLHTKFGINRLVVEKISLIFINNEVEDCPGFTQEYTY